MVDVIRDVSLEHDCFDLVERIDKHVEQDPLWGLLTSGRLQHVDSSYVMINSVHPSRCEGTC